MTEDISPVRPSNFKEAHQHAKTRLRHVSHGMEDAVLQKTAVPHEVFEYFFTLQVQVEKEGPMDYHKYAKKLWNTFTGEEPTDDMHGFKQFEKRMIFGLHHINMAELIQPSLAQSMPELVEKYKDDIEALVLWSTGDVHATGYQLGKIANSQIISQFLHTLPKEERSKFAKEKTAYIVDGNKFDRFADYAEHALQKDPTKPVKIVIIEDTVANFEKARKIADERLGAESEKVEIIPIWYTGSNEGVKAQKKVDIAKESGDMATYEQEKKELESKKKKLNAIDSFDQLLDRERFGKMFNQSHVFVDFDGVISDNIQMRNKQAEAVFNALINGIHLQTGHDAQAITKSITEKLHSITSS